MRKFLNRSGFTMVEVMVALGLTAVAALAFMRLTENQVRTQSKISNRAEMMDTRQEFKLFLQSTKTCTKNLQLALSGSGNIDTVFPISTQGNFDPIKDKLLPKFEKLIKSDPVQFADVYDLADPKLNEDKFRNKFKIKRMFFRRTAQGVPEDYPMEFHIEFEFCPKGGLRCSDNEKNTRREIVKPLSFKSIDGTVGSVTCTFAGDAAQEEDKKKMCKIEKMMYIMQGFPSEFTAPECGEKLDYKSIPYQTSLNTMNRNKFIPGSLQVVMVGAGGGGSGSKALQDGNPGYAGTVIVEKLINFDPSIQCSVILGKGGLGGGTSGTSCKGGRGGTSTTFNCGNLINLTAQGGPGNTNCGNPGAGPGYKPAYPISPVPSVMLFRGAGGAGYSTPNKSGDPGQDGQIVFSWKEWL